MERRSYGPRPTAAAGREPTPGYRGPVPGRSAEVERLRAVYGDYDRDDAARRRWDLANPGNRAIHAERTARIAALADSLADPVLDVGCGTGQVLEELAGTGATPPRRIGVDLVADRLIQARTRVPDVALVQAEGSALPFPDATVGTALAFTLFSSLLAEELARAVAAEVTRVVRPGGALLWYDLRRRNPRNPAVRAWTALDVAELFPGWDVDLAPVTVLPPLVRHLGPLTPRAYPGLARVRFLTTHLLGVVRRPR